MRKLLFLLILGTVLWSGYWFAGSSALRQGAEDWFAQQSARGVTAERSALSVVGFPNRFDLKVEGLRLADPVSGIGWQAPFAEVYAMTWKPWHIIAALPPDQVINRPGEEIALTSQRLRASVRTRPSTDVPLAAVVAEADSFRATSTDGWTVAAGRTVASLSADEEVPGAGDAPNAYVIALDMADLAPDPAATARILAEAQLPPDITVIRLRATATLDQPLDRNAGQTRPTVQTLAVNDVLVTWGAMSVTATGTIAPDADGFAAGRIDIAVTNWQPLVPAMVAAGAIKPELAPTVETMLTALARDTGDENVLKLPLVLQDGRMSLGPVPLGEAPQLRPPAG
jgi:hypothetical protein